MKRFTRWVPALPVICAISLLTAVARAQETFLDYEFEDEDELLDFFVPPRAIGCGANIELGSARVDDGELLLVNGAGGGSMMTLFPDVVEDSFPDPRDYRLRMRINFETHSGIFYVFVRTRVGVDEDLDAADITDELGYPVYLDVASQQFGVIEESNCNVAIPHPEWPGNGTWALTDPGFPLEIGDDWYWMEVSVSGDDDGGPVRIEAATWPDGEDPPDEPQFVLEDTDGLVHTETTRLPSRDVQILFLNLFGAANGTVRIDDVSFEALGDEPEIGPFLRGDCNGDGAIGGVTDAVFLLNFNFLGGGSPPCLAACDSNGDGEAGGVTDAVYLLGFNFLGGQQPPPPFPECSPSDLVTDEALGCQTPVDCPR